MALVLLHAPVLSDPSGTSALIFAGLSSDTIPPVADGRSTASDEIRLGFTSSASICMPRSSSSSSAPSVSKCDTINWPE
uniref:Putative secreted protein n=1 Tax=Anopheles darlingi TaxID=43151 RepID=A0A2M4DJF5_ANODA